MKSAEKVEGRRTAVTGKCGADTIYFKICIEGDII